MEWIQAISNSIRYIEQHITDEDLNVKKIAESVSISPFYFQKGFAMLCGYTVGEYIRNRRLSLAGGELLSSEVKIIDLAVKYGYNSPDSFTKAFIRFHGCTPTEVRKGNRNLKSFAPLRIKFTLYGGKTMDYRIETKTSFKVMGISRKFSYESAFSDIPKFWVETLHQSDKKNMPICGKYGVNYDKNMSGTDFRYMIGGDYDKEKAEQFDLEVWEIPEHTWAVFPCRGKMPEAFQELNKTIFSEWLAEGKYEIAEGYNIEFYSDPKDYKGGTQDPEYYCEIRIPIKEK